MTMEAFQDAVARGLGRAVLCLDGRNSSVYADEIVAACMTNQQYDPQCEEERSSYLMDLLERAGLEETVLALLLEDPSPSNDRDRLQRQCLLREFARKGEMTAWTRLTELALDDVEVADRIVELGLIGLEWVGENIAPSLVVEDRWKAVWWINDAAEVVGRKEIEASSSIAVQKLLKDSEELVAESRSLAAEKKREQPSPSQALSGLKEKRLANFTPKAFAQAASPEELRQAAGILLGEQDRRTAWRLSKIWRYAPFPLDPLELIGRVEAHEYPDALLKVLGTIDSPVVREYALDLLRTRPLPFSALEPLMSTFLASDTGLLMDAMNSAEDEELRHDIGSDALNLLDKWPDLDPMAICEWVYENGPCSLCRNDAVRRMVNAGVLPERIRIEAVYDSDSDTRNMAIGYGKLEECPAT